MELRSIPSGTALTLSLSTSGDETLRAYEVIFRSAETRASFLVEDEALYADANGIDPAMHFKINFFEGPRLYTFKGKLRRNVTKNNQRLTQIDQISDIKEGTRRISPRHEILTSVVLYESMENWRQNEPLVQGQTMNISSDGLCLLTNKQIFAQDKEHRYILEFMLTRNDRYLLQARLVRQSENTSSVQYQYDYGFLFDYGDRPAERTRMITSLFKYRHEGR